MRTALLTIWHEKNYGAELQAYATIKALRNLGHSVQMIDIRLSDMRYSNYKQKVVDIISYFGQDDRSFNHFWKKYIPTTRRYRSIEELKSNPPVADVFLVGSDQVWNPDITKDFSSIFFLNFGSEQTPRISYASSFGKESWTHPEQKEYVREQLKKFLSVSCREESGVTLLRSEFGIESKCVVDPTLLIDDYSELTGPIKEEKTLVYYPLSYDEELESYSISLAKRLGLSPINNRKEYRIMNRIPWKKVSIEEWVRNIAQSQFVITRSFHGLVFCLLHQRQFAILASRNGRGDRLVNLLKLVGLENRYYLNTEAIDRDKPWERKIDYNIVTKILKQQRGESLNYLIISLNRAFSK